MVQLLDLLLKLHSYRVLKDDWDTYGALAPSGSTIDAAMIRVTELAEQLQPLPDWVVPSSDGGIWLEWPDREVEIEGDR